METAFGIVISVVFFGGFGWFLWDRAKIEKRRLAELTALAERHGWALVQSREGRRHVTTLTARDHGWSLRLASGFSSGGKSSKTSHPGFTEMRLPQPVWPRGMAVFSQRLAGGLEQMTGGSGLVGFLQNSAVKTLLSRVVPPGVLDSVGRLTPFPAPPGIELSILATEEPHGLDLQAIHDAVQLWQPAHQRGVGAPAVTLGPEGLSYRLPERLNEAEDIASFIAEGEALGQRLAA